MAVFGGFAHVSTRRFVRRVALASLLFAAIIPMNARAADNYTRFTCPNQYVVCNMGFWVDLGSPLDLTKPINRCVECGQGYYKMRRDTKGSASSGENFQCIEKPANTISGDACPVISITKNNTTRSYGRVLPLCKVGYYRDWKSSGHTDGFVCSPCPQYSTKPADTASGVTNVLETKYLRSDNELSYDNTSLILNLTEANGLIGAKQCNTCVDSGADKGYPSGRYGVAAGTCFSCATADSQSGVKECNSTTGEVRCKAGFYRKKMDSGQIVCTKCDQYYTKPEDAANSNNTGSELCNKCDTDAYRAGRYGNVNYNVGSSTCLPCPTTGVKACHWDSEHEGNVLCDIGYYRSIDSSTGAITCVACENGTTKPSDDGTCASNDEEFCDSQRNFGEKMCLYCISGGDYYSVSRDSDGELDDFACYQCDENASQCGGDDFSCDENGECGGSDNGIDPNDIICGIDHYRVTDLDGTVSCEHCPTGTQKPTPSSSEIDGPSVCNKCASGYFAPNADNQSPESCQACPGHNAFCDSGNVGCEANYYMDKNSSTGIYSCKKCPRWTGKLKDATSKLNLNFGNITSFKQCDLCVDGYYGGDGDAITSPPALNCTPCPAFAKLDVLGICIHGTTLAPNNRTSDSNWNKSVSYCQVPVHGAVGGDAPTFTDSMGQFEFNQTTNNATSNMCIVGQANVPLSSLCTIPARQYCVYVNLDAGLLSDSLGDEDACVNAVVFRSAGMISNNNGKITADTARDVVRMWGKDNPWYCTDKIDEAKLFVDCLRGTNNPTQCTHNPNASGGINDAYCMGNDTGKVKICQMNDDSSACVDVDY